MYTSCPFAKDIFFTDWVNNRFNVSAIKNISKFKQIRCNNTMALGEVWVRGRHCFCNKCLNREWDKCEDLYKANNPWKQFKMQLNDLVDDTEDDLSYENAIKEQFKAKKIIIACILNGNSKIFGIITQKPTISRSSNIYKLPNSTISFEIVAKDVYVLFLPLKLYVKVPEDHRLDNAKSDVIIGTNVFVAEDCEPAHVPLSALVQPPFDNDTMRHNNCVTKDLVLLQADKRETYASRSSLKYIVINKPHIDRLDQIIHDNSE